MPQDVTKEIRATEIRRGDRLVAIDGAPVVDLGEVTDVSRKVTYAYITREAEHKQRRIYLNVPVTVIRTEPTDDEKQVQEREWKRDTLVAELRKMLDATPLRAIGEVVDKARAREGEDAYDVLTSYVLADLLKTQALHRQALRIRARLTRDGEHVDVEDASVDELVTAYAMWYYETVNRAGWQGPRVDPTSRSTSTLSNLLEDLEVWAAQEITYRIMWSGAQNDVLARVETFKAMSKNRH
jgi:hypothetical protein